MKNLEQFGVQGLNIEEQTQITGGGNGLAEGLGYFVGATLGVFMVTVKYIAENLGSFSG